MVKKVDKHYLWDASVEKGAYDAATTFLDDTNPPFNFTDMFFSRESIWMRQLDTILYFFELVIHKYGVYHETHMCIHIDYSMN